MKNLMNRFSDELTSREHERRPEDSISGLPGAELLLDIDHAREIWPKEVAENKDFLAQVRFRKELVRRLEVVASALPRPDRSLEDAVQDKELTEDQVADLYESVGGLLAPDSEYQRILLYLPFEFLPRSGWEPESERLTQAARVFRVSYLSAWEHLLAVHDVRANFVDGDVVEVEQREGDLPRVVKAAHLIPKLVEAGFMTVDDVLQRMDGTDDKVLRQSIADTLPVLRDMGFMEGDAVVSEIAEAEDVTLDGIEEQIAQDFARVDAMEYGNVTKKRKVWLAQEGKRKVIDVVSGNIQVAIETGRLDGFELKIASVNAKRAFIEGVRKAVEARASVDQESAEELYAQYGKMLETLWESDATSLGDVLAKAFFRLHGLGVIPVEQLKAHDLTLPALAGPFSENLKGFNSEMAEVKQIVEILERDSSISQLVFPVVLVYGSRLKGYGSLQSDIDVAVFVKPGVSDTQKAQMRVRLKQLFSHNKIGGEVLEFWTQSTGSRLGVIDHEGLDSEVGESYWIHILFGAVWEGKQKEVNELRAKLFVPYFYDDGKILYGRPARGLGLEELERDTLQYRLMHKGYEKFHPSYGGIHTLHADSIDGKSMFWDSGYRQMATKLYASRVFLPKLERPE